MFPVASKILIVDDSSFLRTVLKNSFKELQYWKILEAESGKVAKRLLLEDEQKVDPVHLMMLDIHMPEYSGLQLLRWVRAQESLEGLPVIILTSSQERAEVFEAAKMGISHYMIKPFDTPTLGERINSTWEKHGQAYVKSLAAQKKTG
ncbi:MAG: response regulator [Bdellovibrionales bacterium]